MRENVERLIVQVQPARKGDSSRPRHRPKGVPDELIVLVPHWNLLRQGGVGGVCFEAASVGGETWDDEWCKKFVRAIVRYELCFELFG